MKKKITAIIISIITVALIATVFIVKDDTSHVPMENPTQSTEKSGLTINLTPNTKSLVVHAPVNSTVLFDSDEIPYDETVKCFRLFTEKGGTHTVTVSKYGCNTVTKEVDFSENSSFEFETDLTLTQQYKNEVCIKAEEYLRRFIEICSNESGDLSSFNFYCEEDKIKAQKVADDIIGELISVDSMHYETGDITVAALRCDGVDKTSETVPFSYDVKGTLVNFTLDYNYTWKYKNTEDDKSGVNSEIQHPFIKIENIGGEWYLREVYLYLRKK